MATASASHTPLWTASRSATERARRASRPSPQCRPTASAPGPRHAPHVVELSTSHHVLTQRLRPTHLDAHRVVAFMQREHVRTHSRSGGQRQRIPVGPHAESHARTGNEEDWQRGNIRSCDIRLRRSDRPGGRGFTAVVANAMPNSPRCPPPADASAPCQCENACAAACHSVYGVSDNACLQPVFVLMYLGRACG